MNITDHDVEILKALWRSSAPDIPEKEIRKTLVNVIGILSRMKKYIYIELTPFEAGVLTSTLYRSVNEGADPVVKDIYNRLISLYNEKYYKD